MADPIDIGPEVRAICEKIGAPYELCASLFLKPAEVTATVYKTNAEGKKYVEGDRIAQEEFTVRVMTT